MQHSKASAMAVRGGFVCPGGSCENWGGEVLGAIMVFVYEIHMDPLYLQNTVLDTMLKLQWLDL